MRIEIAASELQQAFQTKVRSPKQKLLVELCKKVKLGADESVINPRDFETFGLWDTSVHCLRYKHGTLFVNATLAMTVELPVSQLIQDPEKLKVVTELSNQLEGFVSTNDGVGKQSVKLEKPALAKPEKGSKAK